MVAFIDSGLELVNELSKALDVTGEWEAGICTDALNLPREFCGYSKPAELATPGP